MQIGRYGIVLKAMDRIERSLIIKKCEYSSSEDKYINVFAREVIIDKGGKKECRRIESHSMDEIRNINPGDVIDMRQYNIIDREKPFSDIGFNRFCELKDVFNELNDIMPDCTENLLTGQICRVYDDNGLLIGKYKILGFVTPDKFGHCVLLNWDCWWFAEKWYRIYPVRKKSIKNKD